jgi:hypothetical protein
MEGDTKDNRTTDVIASQEEADGIRQGLERRKAIPDAELSPEIEEANALDEARLAQWEALHPVPGHSVEEDLATQREALTNLPQAETETNDAKADAD